MLAPGLWPFWPRPDHVPSALFFGPFDGKLPQCAWELLSALSLMQWVVGQLPEV